ncbi:MAG: universal stress protein [Chloroflexi bacterium]|nr:universal stress protein [Chloroflexota bacterium]
MYKKILAPLDGSETSEAVLAHVRALAQYTGAEVVLLRVVTQPAYESVFGDTVLLPTAPPPEESGNRAHAEGYLQRVAFDHFPQEVQVTCEVSSGPIAETILDYASAIEADLIAMSTHGRSGLARMVIGSVADEIVRRSHLPVLLVRPEE